jgi:hypothetical protein
MNAYILGAGGILHAYLRILLGKLIQLNNPARCNSIFVSQLKTVASADVYSLLCRRLARDSACNFFPNLIQIA